MEKTLFKSIMIRLLKSSLADESEDFGSVLTEEILEVDRQLLQVERLTNDFSGEMHCNKLHVSNSQKVVPKM